MRDRFHMVQTTIRRCRRARRAGDAARVLTSLAIIAMTWQGVAGAQVAASRRAYERVAALVRESSPALASAHADLDAAVAGRDAAGRSGPAQLSAELEEAPSFRLGEANYSLVLSREFLIGGRGAAARSVAAVDVAATTARVAWWDRIVEVEAERELTRWLGWSAVAGRLAAQDSLLARAEAALRDRLAVGESRYADVLRVGAERLRTAAERSVAAAAAGEARARLEALAGGDRGDLGRVLDSLVSAGALPAGPPAPPPEDSLLTMAPGVQRAAAELGRAEAEWSRTRAETQPRLEASLGAQLAGEGDGRGVGPVAGVSVSLPFTAAATNQRVTAAATSVVAAAEARLAAARLRHRGALRASARRLSAALERVALFETGLLAAARAERGTALDAYAAGEISLLEFLDFERATAQVEVVGLHAVIDAADAWAALWWAPSAEETQP